MKFEISGTFSSNGAKPGAKLFDPKGNEIAPEREILKDLKMQKGKKWCPIWIDRFKIAPEVTYLLIITDCPVSGDVLYATGVVGNGKLSYIQQQIKKDFLKK